jgi:8-oxo-dGTP pyrophosphatase MutT (NUDIX family)
MAETPHVMSPGLRLVPRQEFLLKPHDGQQYLSGELTERPDKYMLDAVALPPGCFQEVRKDLSRYAPVEVTRVAMRKASHVYLGIIDSAGTPFLFAYNSRGLLLRPAIDAEKAWLMFDRMMEEERIAARHARRDQADGEQSRLNQEFRYVIKAVSYGHTAYQRRDPRTGKLISVRHRLDAFDAAAELPLVIKADKWKSAGGVVFQRDKSKPGGIAIALVKPKNSYGGYAWTFPKGQIEPGETPHAAARREVFEESGLKGDAVADLGSHEGTMSHTQYFLMSLDESAPKGAFDDETEEVRFVDFNEAKKLLHSERDLNVLEAAKKQVKAGYAPGLDNDLRRAAEEAEEEEANKPTPKAAMMKITAVQKPAKAKTAKIVPLIAGKQIGFKLPVLHKVMSHPAFHAKLLPCPYGGGKECLTHGGDGAKKHKQGYIHTKSGASTVSVDEMPPDGRYHLDAKHKMARGDPAKLALTWLAKESNLDVAPEGSWAGSRDSLFEALLPWVEENFDGDHKGVAWSLIHHLIGRGAISKIEHAKLKPIKVAGGVEANVSLLHVHGVKTSPLGHCPFGGGSVCMKHGGDGSILHHPGYAHPKDPGEHMEVDLDAFHRFVQAAAANNIIDAADGTMMTSAEFMKDVGGQELVELDAHLLSSWEGSSDSCGALHMVAALETVGILRQMNAYYMKRTSHKYCESPDPSFQMVQMAVLARYEYTQAVLRHKYPSGFMPLGRGTGKHPALAAAALTKSPTEWIQFDQNPLTSWSDQTEVPGGFTANMSVSMMTPISNVLFSYHADWRKPSQGSEGQESVVITPEGTMHVQARHIAFGASTPEYIQWAKTAGLMDKYGQVKEDAPDTVTSTVYAKQIAGAKKKSTPKGGSKKVSEWTLTDREAGGSQGGRWFKDKNNVFWFAKHYDGDKNRLAAEQITNEIYGMFGIRTPETKMDYIDGYLHLFSREEPGKVAGAATWLYNSDVTDGFAVDAWLGNWDVIGLDYDNVILRPGGSAVRIDNGGALLWRAKGQLKAAFDEEVIELDMMRDVAYPSGKVFGALSTGAVRDQVNDFYAQYNARADAIDKIIQDNPYLADNYKTEIVDALRARAGWMVRHVSDYTTFKALTRDKHRQDELLIQFHEDNTSLRHQKVHYPLSGIDIEEHGGFNWLHKQLRQKRRAAKAKKKPKREMKTFTPLSKALWSLMMLKADKPYGHTAYQRRDPRTGKMVQVQARGARSAALSKPLSREIDTSEYETHTNKAYAGAPIEQVDAVHAYTDNDWESVNKALRAAKGGQLGEAVVQAQVSAIDALIAKSVFEKDVTVYRGFDDFEAIRGLKAGDVFQDHGFVSASTKQEVGEHFAEEVGVLLKIDLPKGAKGLAPRSKNAGEHEIILPRSSKFEVVEVERGYSSVTIHLKAIV